MKKYSLVGLSLVFCLMFSLSVYAADNTFQDVNVDDSCYSAVEYLADKGVVKGCGDSKFNPDKNITLNHFAIMLVRAFGDSKYADRPLPICHSNGWIDMYTVSQDPNSDITRGGVYQALFTVNNVSVFNDGDKRISWDDYANTVEKLVGFKNDKDLRQGITRGEVAELIYYFMANDIQIEVPEILKGLVIENESQNIGNYVYAFEKVPSVVLEKFKQDGWKINLTNKEFAKYQAEMGVLANGLCDYSAKMISLKTPSSLVHEFGHYVDYISDYQIGIDDLYSLEGDALAEIKGAKAANSHEYFAEYFDKYINAKINLGDLDVLREKTPNTFKYFSELESDNWGIK